MSTSTGKILFYTGEWDCFSNFSAFQVDCRGELWPTVEHAYQAAKFEDWSIAEKVLKAISPWEAYEIAHSHEEAMYIDWDVVKLDIMEDIVRAKAEQHLHVRKKLAKSLDSTIFENSSTDSFWGRGTDWHGKNHLGKIWMKLRDEMNAGLWIGALNGPLKV